MAHPAVRRRLGVLAVGIAALVTAAAAAVVAAVEPGNGHPTRAGSRARVSAVTGSPVAAAAEPAGNGSLPRGFRWLTVTAPAGTNAGFTVAVPDGWTAGAGPAPGAARTYLGPPGGHEYLQVDLTRHTYTNMTAEAHWLAAQTLRQGRFPGYRGEGIRAVRIRGTDAAAWQFTWLDPAVGRVRALDLMFIAPTAAGPQSYALYMSAPEADWQSSLASFDEEVRTFRPVPR